MKLTRQFGSHSGCSEFALLHAKYTQWNDKSACLDIEMIFKNMVSESTTKYQKTTTTNKKRKQNKPKRYHTFCSGFQTHIITVPIYTILFIPIPL